MAFDLEKLKRSVIDGDTAGALELTRQALAEHEPLDVLINQGLIAAMSVVGKLFEEGEFFIPEMLIAARAMQSCMDILKPLLSKTESKPLATVVLGTVKGDLHDIGKNLVRMMLQGAVSRRESAPYSESSRCRSTSNWRGPTAPSRGRRAAAPWRENVCTTPS